MRATILATLLIIGCDNPSVKTENNLRPTDVPVEYNIQPNVSMGGMSVDFPNPTQWQNQGIYIPGFGNTVYHHMMNINDSGKGYMIAWVDYPIPQKTLSKLSDSDIQKVLEGGRDGACANMNGKLVWDKKSNLSGIPGREFSCAGSEQGIKFLVHARIYLKVNRLFMFMSVSPISNPLNDEKFFSSISAQ